jgi:L-lactate utilization protein LutC
MSDEDHGTFVIDTDTITDEQQFTYWEHVQHELALFPDDTELRELATEEAMDSTFKSLVWAIFDDPNGAPEIVTFHMDGTVTFATHTRAEWADIEARVSDKIGRSMRDRLKQEVMDTLRSSDLGRELSRAIGRGLTLNLDVSDAPTTPVEGD